jgi:DNA primase
VDSALWNIEIRRPLTPAQTAQGDIKYVSIKGGSKQVLLGAELVGADKPVVLVEGAFDRLAIHQAAADLVTAVAAGSTIGARQSTWLTRLATRPVLVAFDADDAGDEGAAWWLNTLGDRAVRWRPDPGYKDPAAMLQAGADLRAWVEAGLQTVTSGPWSVTSEQTVSVSVSSPTTDHQPLATDTDPCAICGAPFDRYDPNGRPLCADHYAAWQAAEADWTQLGQRQKSEERGARSEKMDAVSALAVTKNYSLIAIRYSLLTVH